MPIDITGTSAVAPKPIVPETIICSKCHQDSLIRPVDLLSQEIFSDIGCAVCGETIVSSRPQVRSLYNYSSHHYVYDDD